MILEIYRINAIIVNNVTSKQTLPNIINFRRYELFTEKIVKEETISPCCTILTNCPIFVTAGRL